MLRQFCNAVLPAIAVVVVASAAGVSVTTLAGAQQYHTPPKDRSKPVIRRCRMVLKTTCYTDANGKRRCYTKPKRVCFGERNIGR